ncbi:heavy metal translocating P-type ATPase [Clostridium botulinum]|uniref:heavy metal translocating P-type ATPase n=1 Tax=Clostridium botulinum TaxID=1491 RepID=UPI0004D74C50|nr:heavy metal translocating P-type ATPase [Clostridium botulinum]KEI03618.1 ATPase [Clostridium botulinum D str. 16868]KLU76993.1 ATPase [Clostridium botulinum V891]KOA73987.1 ATPase [Clostridium botulinum]KOA92874.1 ATPase [Clostridium botulinum]KOC34227.1 ATPase [Clostridium botulinum]
MDTNVKKEIILEGLCCANCASKIERSVNNMDEVDNATIDFLSKKLIIEVKDKDKVNEVLNKTTKIVNNIEPDVKVIYMEDYHTSKQNHNGHDHSHSHEEENSNKKIIRLGIGAVIFAVATIFKFSFYTELALFSISYILIGGEIVLRALRNITRGQVFDENFLMTVATIGAFAIKEFPEGVAVMLFYQVGEYFQDRAIDHSRKSISSLMDIRPDYANVKVKNDVKRVSPEEVNIGDVIIVKPGEKIPLDGTIIEGKSMVDTSALTGESVPRDVEIGNEVLGGFLNKNGVLTIKVSKEFKESTVSKILDLVQNASSRKAPTENFITKFAMYYTPVVVMTAMILAIVPPFIIPDATFSQWIYRALVFLVVSCPCALVISIPLSFFGGIGGASRNGILIKGGNYLEALNLVETVIFDKTGTLTKGVFDVTEISPVEGVDNEKLLEYAAFAESYSNHPIAISILKAYNKEINKEKVESYDEISGHGIRVKVEGKEILSGNSKLMIKENIKFDKIDKSGTIVYVAVDKQYLGYILISDEIKEDAKKAISYLKSIGVKNTVMLTGDSKIVAEEVGEKIGVDEVYAELLPNDKVEKLEYFDKNKSSKGKIVFVGDGINDAPVLARADIGIAMGGLGSDAAIEAADIVIMTDEPSKIYNAIKIAKKTKYIVMQNIGIALGVKLIVLILGALGIANMWEAVFADVGVALIAVLNAMRVLKKSIQ